MYYRYQLIELISPAKWFKHWMVGLKVPGSGPTRQRGLFLLSGCTQPYTKNQEEGLPLCPLEGALSCLSQGDSCLWVMCQVLGGVGGQSASVWCGWAEC